MMLEKDFCDKVMTPYRFEYLRYSKYSWRILFRSAFGLIPDLSASSLNAVSQCSLILNERPIVLLLWLAKLEQTSQETYCFVLQ